MVTEVVWWVLAIGTVAAAAGIVFSRAVTHAAVAFILALLGVAAQFIFLHNEFLALVQVLIYGGAVAVLLMLALMVTRQVDRSGRAPSLTGSQWPWALLAGGVLSGLFITVAVDAAWPGDGNDDLVPVPLDLVSETLFGTYGVPFLLASALLLVALIGAIILGRTEERE